MKLLGTVTAYAVPVFILVAVLAACVKGHNPYSCFINGAKDGIKGAAGVLPYIVAVMFATELFCSSGLAGIAGRALSAALTHIGIPDGLGLFLLLRPLSGSGALAEMSSIFNTYGPDSPQGIFASVLMGSTETIFYTIPVYLSAAGLKSSAKAVIISLVSMLAGVLSASLLLNIWG